MITIIVAVTRSGAIGRRGDLIYHISADLKHFKALTMGHPVIMGRKTFESLPGGALPGRRNVVISGNASFQAPGVEVYPSLDAALEATAGEEPFIIGGARVYKEAIEKANRLEITEIEADAPADADTFFPPVNATDWKLTQCTEPEVDARSGVRYRFATYDRIR